MPVTVHTEFVRRQEMIAMTAARLGEPEQAIDWLFADRKNNKWGPTGMTPRVHLESHASDFVPPSAGAGGVDATNPDGPGYRRAAETYFPSNGSLLMAVGLMAAGWEGSTGIAPGFPKKGWHVRVEGLTRAGGLRQVARPLPQQRQQAGLVEDVGVVGELSAGVGEDRLQLPDPVGLEEGVG